MQLHGVSPWTDHKGKHRRREGDRAALPPTLPLLLSILAQQHTFISRIMVCYYDASFLSARHEHTQRRGPKL